MRTDAVAAEKWHLTRDLKDRMPGENKKPRSI